MTSAARNDFGRDDDGYRPDGSRLFVSKGPADAPSAWIDAKALLQIEQEQAMRDKITKSRQTTETLDRIATLARQHHAAPAPPVTTSLRDKRLAYFVGACSATACVLVFAYLGFFEWRDGAEGMTAGLLLSAPCYGVGWALARLWSWYRNTPR